MKKLLLVCVSVLAFSVSAIAQDFSKIDAFAGYSFVRFRSDFKDKGGNAVSTRTNLNGAIGSVAFNTTKSIGIVAEFGGCHYSKITAKQSSGSQSLNASATVISYLFGPRISIRKERITPFVQALFGGAHSGAITGSGAPPCPTAAACTALSAGNAFAMAFGGGVDVKAAKHFSLRLGQVDYLLTRFATLSGSGVRQSQHSFRYSAGVVLH